MGGAENKYVFIFTSKTRADNSDVCFGSCKWGWNLISVCCGTFVCWLSYLLICLQTQSMRVFVVIYVKDNNNEWSKTLGYRHSRVRSNEKSTKKVDPFQNWFFVISDHYWTGLGWFKPFFAFRGPIGAVGGQFWVWGVLKGPKFQISKLDECWLRDWVPLTERLGPLGLKRLHKEQGITWHRSWHPTCLYFEEKTSQELRMLSRSLSDCKSLLLNVMIQVSQFIRNGQLCH